MFRRLLVPLDLTDRHQTVLDVAAEMAQKANGEITLLHVIETIHGLSVDEERSFFAQLQRSAEQHLEARLDILRRKSVPCRRVVIKGNRAIEIARYAKEIDADLILLTAPTFDPEQPTTGWGSMSFKVGLLAQCPVLFVKQRPTVMTKE